jgi:putative restriction endonuclease
MRLPSTLMMFIQTYRRNCSKLGENTSLVLPEARYGSGSAISPKAPEKGYFQSSIESGPLHCTNHDLPCARSKVQSYNALLARSMDLCTCARLGFLSILNRSTGLRDVKLAWVESSDDGLKQFKLSYAERRLTHVEPQRDEESFVVAAPRTKEEVTTNRSKRHPGFKFDVLSYYNDIECCLCDVRAPRLLDAAHIVDVQHNGTDDPRNGLILCANHHRAYDAQMIAIEPGSHRLKCAPKQPSFDDLGITKTCLASLAKKPHNDALAWRWARWKHKRASNPS